LPTVFCRYPDVTLEWGLVPHTNWDQNFLSGAGFQNINMKKFSFTILICLLVLNATAQNQQGETLSSPSFPGEEAAFPKSFIGNWQGELQWMVAGKPTQTFTIQLKIQPTDAANQYTWQIIYGDNDKDNRPYLLKPVDTAKGHWIVDELDGIILDSYVHGNSIHGAFTVQGNTIVDNYRVENDTMLVEFFSFKLVDKKTSGKGTDETPFVDSYRMGSYQMGKLNKMR